MPLFSVIIPVFNAEPWLRECLDSIAKQTVSDFEIIITNDGSTDKSNEVIQFFRENNPSISVKVIEQENKGLGNARNKAVKIARFLALIPYCDNHKRQ